MADLIKNISEAIEAIDIEIKEQLEKSGNVQTREVLMEKMCTVFVYFNGFPEARYLRYEIAKKASILKRRAKNRIYSEIIR